MRLGMGIPKEWPFARSEARIPMEVGVQISGHPALPGTESTFTENVSTRGARVLSNRRWRQNDRLTIATLTGSFRALARVTYCQIAPQSGFAIGLEFLEPSGKWIVGAAHAY
jgi:hypothetical protein